MQLRERAVGGVERVVVGVADARHDVPVVPGPAGELERRARGHDVQAPLRVEHVGEPEQVVLVGAAPVMEHDQAGGIAVRRPLAVLERAHATAAARGLTTGDSTRSSCSRRCSCWAGSFSASPRCSGSSSTAKPGESVAISNSTPRGSRK